MGTLVALVWIANTVVFVIYVRRRGYQVVWAVLASGLFGPLTWPGWLLIRWAQRRGERLAEDRPREYSALRQ